MSSKTPKLDTIRNNGAPKLATLSGTSSKETVYVDVDDEITTIIDKVRVTKGKIVALVLPKRATVLQSIVNMKLLKRTANEAGKNLVLVTTEAGLLPLAGMVGLHVADTPTSRPGIPPKPDLPSEEPEAIEESLAVADNSGSGSEFDIDEAANIPVGELASSAGAAALAGEIDEELVMADMPSDKPNATLLKKNKKLAIPNFDKFRIRLILGALLLIVIVSGWFFAATVLPKATISIETNSEVVKSNLILTLDTAAKGVDVENKILPATAQSEQKNLSQQVATTGQQNNGSKATGSVIFSATQCAPNINQKPDSIPVGTSVKSNNHTYITQEKATYSLDGFPSGSCALYKTNATSIQALKGGAEYNTDTSADFTGSNGTTGTGSATGGTDAIVKIVTQADIDSAKAQIAAQDATKVKQDLSSALQAKDMLPVEVTFVTGSQQITSSAKVGDAVDTLTVTSVVPYTMLGIKESDLNKIIVANVESKIDADKQKILEDGIDSAQYTIQDNASATSAIVNAKIQSVAGPELDVESLKKQVSGKKSGDIKSALGGLPGVTKVDVKYSPFWVTTAPSNTSKITIHIAKPSGTN
jgi:hypothetical protein